ncbi:hypothetical protein HYDPIDRAFT_26418 [Hydnomerulius pinastri MD-312]|nr:hypothetical protein HYDPIDRAFT_26418 [Hydnomerulius pinastri MD-312]
MSQIPGFDPNLILGPVELGVVFASILFGCAVVQTYVYYKKFPKDPWRIKALVASEMALQIAHLLCLIAAMWTMTVSNYGAPQTLISWPHTSIAAVLLSAPITFPVQAFFTWRLYKISQDRIIPAFCFLLAFARLVCNSILGIAGFYIPDALVYEQKYKWAITSVLASSICCDVTIAAALSYHLYSRRGSGMKQ